MRLLRPAEAAQVLGVSRSEIYRLVELGVVPAVRLAPRVLRIPEDELAEAIARRRLPTDGAGGR
ncbi:MAG TPA: helix-turn-helix domain-containing protein [Actinomycetota bacterium]|nr:helix-turn-helix domain-containing protein [Actinomycetota bacterium]